MKCPKCGSKDVDIVDEELGFVKCRTCGFDELDVDVEFGGRKSQREKTKFNPYKAGGARRGK